MITVIAGVNGAGKSSVFGSHVRAMRGEYFNPDEVAARMLRTDPKLTREQANGLAWQANLSLLDEAIAADDNYIFETTLGGATITLRLHHAMDIGRDVRILFCGLGSPELHIERVAARVKKGGHPIPEAKIRERCTDSIHNFMTLLPRCQAVRVLDNSGTLAQLQVLFALEAGRLVTEFADPMSDWAKPLATVAIQKLLQ